MSVRLYGGDCLDVLSTLPTASVDAVVTDPPAGITFMGAAWDSDKGGRRHWVAWLAAILAEARRVARPGSHALVWALPRTSHWTATAMEDAGWAIRDVVTHLQAQGFPKHRHALRPASEHWILARAPLAAPSVAANIARYGTGGLQVERCRIGTDSTLRTGHGCAMGYHGAPAKETLTTGSACGRWPANVVLSCCGEDPCAEGCPVAALGRQSGFRRSSGDTRRVRHKTGYGDAGTAARFFYVAKASPRERDAGLDAADAHPCGVGALRTDGRGKTARNTHPTVKPIKLMQYLCRLITPPGGVVLDPFAGSGTTGIACVREGYSFIGIEREPAYVAIAQQRLAGARTEAAP